MPRLWRLPQRGVGHWLLPFLCWATTTTVYVLHLYSFSSLPFSLRLSSSSSSGHYPGCPSAFLAPFAEMREGKGRRKGRRGRKWPCPRYTSASRRRRFPPRSFRYTFPLYFFEKRSSSPFFQFTISKGEPLITVKAWILNLAAFAQGKSLQMFGRVKRLQLMPPFGKQPIFDLQKSREVCL